ncbi:MAG: hypothetical protein IPI14_11475 [Polaromonas sp.]|nr:hypothetical protein [Polaromonas sp.]
MQSAKPPNILVADDHAMMRDGIVLMIQTAWPGSWCEIADDFQGVIAKIDASNDGERFCRHRARFAHAWYARCRLAWRKSQRAAGVPVIVCTALEGPQLGRAIDFQWYLLCRQ